MPSTIEATNYFLENGVAFMPGKAANAGGVLVSGLEMSQNAEHLSWSFEEVDGKLEQLMRGMFHNVDDTLAACGHEGQLSLRAQTLLALRKLPMPRSLRRLLKSESLTLIESAGHMACAFDF